MLAWGAIERLGLPLDRIVHAEVWATDTIQADLPPMVEFKAKADAIIKERWGVEVEHIRSKWTFESHFLSTAYLWEHEGSKSAKKDGIYGFLRKNDGHFSHIDFIGMPRCPNCGAKMEG